MITSKVFEISEEPEKGSSLLGMGIIESAQKLMASEKVKPELRLKAAKVVNKIAENPELRGKLAETAELAPQLVKTLEESCEKIAKGAPIQQEKPLIMETLGIVQNISKSNDGVDSLLEEGSMATATKTLKVCKNDPELVAKSLETLSGLTIDEEASKEFQTEKGLEMIEDILEKYVDVLEVLRKIARQIGDLAKTPQDQTNMVNKGFVDKLYLGLNKFKMDTILEVNTTYALERLGRNVLDNRKTIISHKILPIVNEIMVPKVEESELMGNIGMLVAGLAYGSAALKTSLGKLGFMDSLGEVFKHYKNNFKEETIVKVLKGIANLATDAPNATTFIQAGNIPHLRELIEKNIKMEEIICIACVTIGNLAYLKFEKNYTAIIKEGVIGTLGRVVFAHETNPKILSCALDALGNLCHTQEIAVMIANMGAIEAIVRILKSLDYNKDLVHKAVKCLRRLSITDSSVAKFYACDGHQRLVSLLQTYSGDQEITNELLRTIKNCISIGKDSRIRIKHMHETGFSDLIFTIFDSKKWTKENVKELFIVLSIMASCEEASCIYGEKGSVHGVEGIIKNMSDGDTVREGITFFSILIKNEINTQHFVNCEGVELINMILRTHQTNSKTALPVTSSLSFSYLAIRDIILIFGKTVLPNSFFNRQNQRGLPNHVP